MKKNILQSEFFFHGFDSIERHVNGCWHRPGEAWAPTSFLAESPCFPMPGAIKKQEHPF